MKRVVLASCFSLAACSTSNADIRSDAAKSGDASAGDAATTTTGDPTSGTRLRARVYAGDDGSQQFAGWHDSSRNEDCSFGMAADGTIRCLPANASYVAATTYSDGGCSQPVVYQLPGCASPQYAIESASSCYGQLTPQRIFSVGAKLSIIYTGTPANCTSATAPTTFDYYSLGAEIPATSFQSATVKTL